MWAIELWVGAEILPDSGNSPWQHWRRELLDGRHGSLKFISTMQLTEIQDGRRETIILDLVSGCFWMTSNLRRLYLICNGLRNHLWLSSEQVLPSDSNHVRQRCGWLTEEVEQCLDFLVSAWPETPVSYEAMRGRGWKVWFLTYYYLVMHYDFPWALVYIQYWPVSMAYDVPVVVERGGPSANFTARSLHHTKTDYRHFQASMIYMCM